MVFCVLIHVVLFAGREYGGGVEAGVVCRCFCVMTWLSIELLGGSWRRDWSGRGRSRRDVGIVKCCDGFEPEVLGRIGREIYVLGPDNLKFPSASEAELVSKRIKSLESASFGINRVGHSEKELEVVREELDFRPMAWENFPSSARRQRMCIEFLDMYRR